ncbi:MAG: hypothetical protein H0Z34_01435 [Brevibacillus sp.]|nr:hypothetical protein [Brevibacillus sp.]
MTWLTWKQAVSFLRGDATLVAGSRLRFPRAYKLLWRFLTDAAQAMEEAAYADLRRLDVRLLGNQLDRGEHFVVWQHRGKIRILRVRKEQLRANVQRKLAELMAGSPSR